MAANLARIPRIMADLAHVPFTKNDYVRDLFNTVESKEYILGDIVEMCPITKHCTSLGKKEGKYRFYTSSQTDKYYLDTYEIDEECLIIGNCGSANVHYANKFTPSKYVTVCKIISKYKSAISAEYLYNYYLYNIDLLENKFDEYKLLDRTNILDLEFKLPSLKIKRKYLLR